MVEMMKAAYWVGPEAVEVREVERPKPGPGEALIKVAYGGICGTDLMIFLGKHPRAKAPLIMCHEIAGTLAEAPDSDLVPGTPVVLNPLLMCGHCYACTHGSPHICSTLGLVGIDRDGGFAEYCVAPLHTVRPVPTSLPLAQAAVVEPLAVAVHAVRVSDLKVGDTTAVLGAGPIGILTAQMARLAGAGRVILSEQSPKRLAMARQLGFETVDVRETNVVDVVREATNGAGVPVAFETAGVQPTIADAGRLVRNGGQILQVGMPKSPPIVDLTLLQFNEIRITPIRVYREEDVEKAIEIASAGVLDLEKPVTHILPLRELEKGLHLAHEAREACKILIAPGA